MRTNAAALTMFLASSCVLCVTLDSHKPSFLHRLVVLFRDIKVFCLYDGLVTAFSFLRRLHVLSLAVGDPSLPSLCHVVNGIFCSGIVWNSGSKWKTHNPFLVRSWGVRDLTGGVCVEQHFASWHQVHRFSVVAVWRDLYLWGERISIVNSYISLEVLLKGALCKTPVTELFYLFLEIFEDGYRESCVCGPFSSGKYNFGKYSCGKYGFGKFSFGKYCCPKAKTGYPIGTLWWLRFCTAPLMVTKGSSCLVESLFLLKRLSCLVEREHGWRRCCSRYCGWLLWLYDPKSIVLIAWPIF